MQSVCVLTSPELKKLAWEEYKYWEPDCILIEAKASGTPLTQELRRMGIPVTAYTPSRGQDKIARMNSVAPIFESGMVWCPDQDLLMRWLRRWHHFRMEITMTIAIVQRWH